MGGAYFVIVLALVLGVMYVMMIRPQRKYQQELRTQVASADVGDDILTNGGIYARSSPRKATTSRWRSRTASPCT